MFKKLFSSNKKDSSYLPGSNGEHELQRVLGTTDKAAKFYSKQMLDFLTPKMMEFLSEQSMFFLSTSDKNGACDCSVRCGDAGFVHVISKKKIAYPDFVGNGVMASMGNISENNHAALLFIDFFKTTIGLHINGVATIFNEFEASLVIDDSIIQKINSNKVVKWVIIDIDEAYIQCPKYLPLLDVADKRLISLEIKNEWADYFGADAIKK